MKNHVNLKTIVITISIGFSLFSFTSCGKVETGIIVKRQINQDGLHVIAHEMQDKNGDSYLIKYKNFEMLVDAGNVADKENIQNTLKDYCKDKELDVLMLSHLHKDHIGAITDTSFFDDLDIKVKTIIDPGTFPTTKTANKYIDMRNELIDRGSEYYLYYDIINNPSLDTKWNIDINKDIYIEFFDTGNVKPANSTYENLNDSSIAFSLVFNKNKWLFAGDLPSNKENNLINSIKKIDQNYFKVDDYVVFKTLHHGSKDSNGDSILSFVKPDLVFNMTGFIEENRTENKIVEQHPYLKTLKRIRKYTENVYWTSINGYTVFLLMEKM